MNYRALTSRTAALAFGLASITTLASASDVLIIVNGTVMSERGGGITSGPFSNVQIGEAVTFVGGCNRPAPGGPSTGLRSSTIDHETFFLKMGNASVTEALNTQGTTVTIANDHVENGSLPVDYLITGFSMEDSGFVSVLLFDPVGIDFNSNDITLLTGNYVQSLPITNLYVGNPIGVNRGLICRIDNLEIVQRSQMGQTLCSAATPNSTGSQGELIAEGFDSAFANDLTIRGTHLPIGQFGMLVGSKTSTAPMTVSNSQGLICLGGSVGRFLHQVRPIGSSATAPGVGTIVFKPDLEAMPQLNGFVPAMAGETWTFQAWHRDVVGGAVTNNFTTAVAVTLR